MASDDQVKQALGQVAKLGGFAIKRMATTDDLKDHTITITITRSSDGWHQERLPFEETIDLVATIDGTNGHVDDIVDPSDLTEKDETQAQAADPDEGEKVGAATGATGDGIQAEQVGAATGVTGDGIQAEQDKVVDISTKKKG